MKYLQDYQQAKQTALFTQIGSFFAFSDKQYKEKQKEGVLYSSLGQGLICPKGSEQALVNGLDEIYTDAIKQDIKENGREAIIKRELGNYECYYTHDYSDVVRELKEYEGITKEMIEKVFDETKEQYYDI